MIYVPYQKTKLAPIEFKEVLEVYIGNTPISEMYNRNDLIFLDLALICFTNGYWIDEFPWDDNSYWMD